MTELLNVEGHCQICKNRFLVLVVKEAFLKWRAGKVLIHEAMPELSAAERELLISQTCDPCFKKLFPPGGG